MIQCPGETPINEIHPFTVHYQIIIITKLLQSPGQIKVKSNSNQSQIKDHSNERNWKLKTIFFDKNLHRVGIAVDGSFPPIQTDETKL